MPTDWRRRPSCFFNRPPSATILRRTRRQDVGRSFHFVSVCGSVVFLFLFFCSRPFFFVLFRFFCSASLLLLFFFLFRRVAFLLSATIPRIAVRAFGQARTAPPPSRPRPLSPQKAPTPTLKTGHLVGHWCSHNRKDRFTFITKKKNKKENETNTMRRRIHLGIWEHLLSLKPSKTQ